MAAAPVVTRAGMRRVSPGSGQGLRPLKGRGFTSPRKSVAAPDANGSMDGYLDTALLPLSFGFAAAICTAVTPVQLNAPSCVKECRPVCFLCPLRDDQRPPTPAVDGFVQLGNRSISWARFTAIDTTFFAPVNP
jgi:hypothetical protein